MSTVLGADAAARFLPGPHGPEDLRGLPADALPTLAEEIRAELIRQVCRTGTRDSGECPASEAF